MDAWLKKEKEKVKSHIWYLRISTPLIFCRGKSHRGGIPSPGLRDVQHMELFLDNRTMKSEVIQLMCEVLNSQKDVSEGKKSVENQGEVHVN